MLSLSFCYLKNIKIFVKKKHIFLYDVFYVSLSPFSNPTFYSRIMTLIDFWLLLNFQKQILRQQDPVLIWRHFKSEIPIQMLICLKKKYNIYYYTYIAYADMSLRKTLLQGICSVRTISCFFKHKKMCKLHMLQGVLNHSSCGYAAKTVISKSFFSKWACSFF